jgi:N-acetylglutamate synthase-like GNAT family acetyltransferase
MTIEEKYDQDLHGGKEIDGLVRYNGHYRGQEDDGSTTVKFDNGNFYVIEDGKITLHIDGKDEYFINDQIVDAIYKFIDLNPLMSKNYTYSEYNAQDEIDFYTQEKTSATDSRGRFIRLVINRESKNIEISNILIDPSLQHNGFGKKIIREIFIIASKHNYRLFLVQMVPGFYKRMVNRGAEIIEFEEIVEITAATSLEDKK